MSTRSYIGIEGNNGEIVYVYCHSDGYLEWNGVLLAKYWQRQEDAQALVGNGAMSSLGRDLDDCYFYCRDEGGEVEISQAPTREELRLKCWAEIPAYSYGGEMQPRQDGLMVEAVYIYSLSAQVWLYSDGSAGEFVPLTDALPGVEPLAA